MSGFPVRNTRFSNRPKVSQAFRVLRSSFPASAALRYSISRLSTPLPVASHRALFWLLLIHTTPYPVLIPMSPVKDAFRSQLVPFAFT